MLAAVSPDNVSNRAEPGLLLRMTGIGKAFAGVPVLDGVEFELRPGEVHILAGENGAGKTTLIKILSGIYSDYAGEISLSGGPVRFRSPRDAQDCGISAIHQEMSLVRPMQVVDNIFLGRERTRGPVWMDFRGQKRRARELLSPLGLDVELSRPAEDYPIAVQQMIEIAKALVYDARIIIMDEPTSALNDQEVERLFGIIAGLKARGCGIIYISHRLEEIFRIGDRITVLRDGRNIGTADAARISPEELIRWMVGREIAGQFPPRSARPGDVRLGVEQAFIPDPTGGKRWAVEDLSFAVRGGEILGIAGLLGSGKSELLHGLFGDYGRLTKGRVTLDGGVFTVRSPKHSIRRGLILQTNDRIGTGLIPGQSVVRNISLASLPSFSPGGWMRTADEDQAARRYVQALAIKLQSLAQEVRTLSGGNQQKVVLAKWLETQPKVLLLDEPTLGVDVGAKHEIYALMNEWTSRGLAILLVTSELPELLAMSDRIIVMHRGRMTAELGPDVATQETVTRAAMGERIPS